MAEIDNYFDSLEEPVKGCMLALRKMILDYDKKVTEAWRYSMPFYFYDGKRFCYLWVNKKGNIPYIGVVDGYKINHPGLIQERRSRMKIFPVRPDKDIPVRKTRDILKAAITASRGSHEKNSILRD